jgi:hypothetical protein
MDAYRTEKVDTPAGVYKINLYQDIEPALHPLEDDSEVFAALVEYSGYGGRWDRATDTLDSAGASGEALRKILAEHDEPEEVGRRYKKWAAIAGSPWVLAMAGRSTVNREYYRLALLANSDELPQVNQAMQHAMDDYHTYANGEICGFVVLAPSGEQVESVWGFYSDDDAISEASEYVKLDAAERVQQANLVGAGIVGLV